jgi:hypothetical protein
MRNNIKFVAIAVILIVIAGLAGCTATSNAKNDNQIAVETIPSPSTKSDENSLALNMSLQDKQSLVEMWSCQFVKHELVKPYENTTQKYDPSKVWATCKANADKTVIDITVFCKKPCSHFESGVVFVKFSPMIRNYNGKGSPIEFLSIYPDNVPDDCPPDTIRFKSGEVGAKLSITVNSDGLDHKITPYFACSYENPEVKLDEFSGDAIEVK